jgi:hypothetical protein
VNLCGIPDDLNAEELESFLQDEGAERRFSAGGLDQLDWGPPQSNGCVDTQWSTNMQPETKFLRLRTPATIGSLFGDWVVTWLGGWTRDRLSYIVMVVKIEHSP